MLIAIDFGTTGSGFALALGNDPKKIMTLDRWPGATATYPKTLSQALVLPSGELVAWGWSARLEHSRLRRQGGRHVLGTAAPAVSEATPSLLSNFKLSLRHGDIHEGRRVHRDSAGREFDLEGLIAGYLDALVEHTLEVVAPRCGRAVGRSDFRWCLTVPAIWTEEQKGAMRKAAVRAGLVDSIYDERLSLVLEPEAAAIACLGEYRRLHPSVPDGFTFLVVDAGGGTLDLTMHEVDGAGIRECVAGDGDDRCGSIFVDREMEKALARVMGEQLWTRFRAEEPVFADELLMAWEQAKGAFTRESPVELLFSRAVARALERLDSGVFERLEARQNGWSDGVSFSVEEVEAIFAPVLSRVERVIARHLKEAIERGARPDVVFLVGGFAESPLLQDLVRCVASQHCDTVVVPLRPGRAVLEGAAQLGVLHDAISSRVCRYTYGVKTTSEHDEAQDPADKRWFNEHKQKHYCRDRFAAVVTRGQSVGAGEAVVRGFETIRPYQSSVEFALYKSLEHAPRYVDGLERIGSCTVTLPEPSADANRKVEVEFTFGKSEIRVVARDRLTGAESHTHIAFDRAFALSEPVGEPECAHVVA